jgi:Aspartyl protease
MKTRKIFTLILAAILSCWVTGCASHHVTVSYGDWHYPSPVYGYQPVIEASINGISGHFVIDTGAMGPALTSTAVHRCGIAVTSAHGSIVGAGGDKVEMLQATNVTVIFSGNYAIHWPVVLVFPNDLATPPGTNENLFGILDYQTLRTHGAVIDTKRKTVTLTK